MMTDYQEYTVRVYKDRIEYRNKGGKLHRLDGPAIEISNGYKAWYVEGKRHRLDGPAIEDSDGYRAWYVEGNKLTEQQFKALTSKPTCSGKIVEIDGIKYQLKEVKND